MVRDRRPAGQWESQEIIDEMLASVHTIAVVGLSDKPHRPSHSVARILREYGYRVIGVNPYVKEIFGEICYGSLAEIPQEVDLVNVFRKPVAVASLVDEVIATGIHRLWLQEGVIDFDAARKARSAGIKVVMDRCIAKELALRDRNR